MLLHRLVIVIIKVILVRNILQDQMLQIVLVLEIVHLCLFFFFILSLSRNSETDAILNALKSTPSVQPVRPVKGMAKQSVKRSAQSNLSSSRFDKRPASPIPSSSHDGYSSGNQSSSMNSGVSQGQSVIQMSLQGVSSSRPSVSDWQVLVNQSGVEYYFNQRTRAVTYQKPDELKSEAEKALKVLLSDVIKNRLVLGKSHTQQMVILSGRTSSLKCQYGRSHRNTLFTSRNWLVFRTRHQPLQLLHPLPPLKSVTLRSLPPFLLQRQPSVRLLLLSLLILLLLIQQ